MQQYGVQFWQYMIESLGPQNENGHPERLTLIWAWETQDKSVDMEL